MLLKTYFRDSINFNSLGQSRLPGKLETEPANLHRLRRFAIQATQGQFGLQSEAPVLSGTISSRSTILIAEDHEDSRMMMRILLEEKGYRVVEANDGHETIEAALRELPLLLLLDLQLPGLGGLDVVRHLRRHQKLESLRIVIISGHDPALHRETAIAAGCDDYLLKPIDFDLLDEILRNSVPLTKGLMKCGF